MRSFHRTTMLLAVVFMLYIGVTGTIIQGIDLTALIARAPATAPTMQSIHDGLDGPPNFAVLTDADYSAASLPTTALNARVSTIAAAARIIIGARPVDFLELRMTNGRLVGRVQAAGQVIALDAMNGALLKTQPADSIVTPRRAGSSRDEMKQIHRMVVVFGGWAMWVELACAVALLVSVTTGLSLYCKLLLNRFRSGGSGLIWSAGGVWRSVHRAVSIAASTLLLVVGVTGSLLAIETISGSLYLKRQGLTLPGLNGAEPLMTSAASPLRDQSLLPMLQTTLSALRRDQGTVPIKLIRLRYYAGMPQGVVIVGGYDTRQLVFNAATGARAGESERGYPTTPFPFGWGAHQVIKQIHRGDYFGLTGRWMDLLTGLSLVFLSVSGGVLYATMWTKRRAIGRPALLWK